MDRAIYTAMTGAKYAFAQQAALAHNLANAATTGFRAQEHRFRAVEVQGEGLPTRAFAVDASVRDVLDQGAMSFTGRSLDAAIHGKGWFAVQGTDGREAYTRNGNFTISPTGDLQTTDGRNVLGDGGPLAIPPDSRVTIAADGTVSVTNETGAQNVVNVIGRLKLVNPPEATMVRGGDGLFRTGSGVPAPVDDTVRLASETLEGSNVNVVDAMVGMISLARQFEMQMRLVQSAEANDRSAGQLFAPAR
jgi:flagellar basal-body rod protein FlgF